MGSTIPEDILLTIIKYRPYPLGLLNRKFYNIAKRVAWDDQMRRILGTEQAVKQHWEDIERFASSEYPPYFLECKDCGNDIRFLHCIRKPNTAVVYRYRNTENKCFPRLECRGDIATTVLEIKWYVRPGHNDMRRASHFLNTVWEECDACEKCTNEIITKNRDIRGEFFEFD
jgi:hypothetical protein